jgi:signal peptidase I
LVTRFWFVLYAVPSGSAEPNLLIGDRICGIKYPYLFKNPLRGDLVIFDQVNFAYSQNLLSKIYQKYIGFAFGPFPAGPETWTKRVVGLSGDRVSLKINDVGFGEVFVNGEKLAEPYRNPHPLILLKRKQGFFPAHSTFFKWPFLGPALASFLQIRAKKLTPYTFDPAKPYNRQPFYNFDEKEVVLNPYTGKPYIFPAEMADPRRDEKAEFVVPKGQVFAIGDNRWNSYDGRDWGCVPLSTVRGRASFICFSVDGTESWWILEFLKSPVDFFCRKMRWSRCFKFLKQGV